MTTFYMSIWQVLIHHIAIQCSAGRRHVPAKDGWNLQRSTIYVFNIADDILIVANLHQ